MYLHCTKTKFSIKDFFGKCDQIRSLLQECLIENFIFCAVLALSDPSGVSYKLSVFIVV